MTSQPNRVQEVAQLIVETLNLKHLKPETLTADMSLFEGGLELDSIDVLELVVVMEQKYNVKIENSEQGKEIFKTIGSIVEFIQQSETTA